jgi:Fe2+ transport system protein B
MRLVYICIVIPGALAVALLSNILEGTVPGTGTSEAAIDLAPLHLPRVARAIGSLDL